MNTGLLRHAVATVLTVYGIETVATYGGDEGLFELQQCLPFTVLKHRIPLNKHRYFECCNSAYRLRY